MAASRDAAREVELAMIAAAKENQLADLKAMLAGGRGQGPGVDARDDDGETALMWASGRGFDQMVRFLVEVAGASVNLQDNWGYTALMLAAQCGKIGVVRYLVGAGKANVFVRCKAGRTARQLAGDKKEAQTTAFLMLAERKAGLFWGMTAPVMTEFDERKGSVVLDNIPKYAAYLSKAGIRGVFVCGTCGESMTLSVPERKSLLETWIAARTKQGLDFAIIAQVGAESIETSRALASHAEAAGADAVAGMIPTFFKPPNLANHVLYSARVAAAARWTHYFQYHFPDCTGNPRTAHDWLALAKGRIPNLAGIKFTCDDMGDYGDLAAMDPENELALLPGYEKAYTAVMMSNAATGRRFGGVALQANFIAPLFNRIIDVCESDLPFRTMSRVADQFQAIGRRLHNLVKATSAIPLLKAAMVRRGIAKSTRVRLPNRQLDADEAKRVDQELARADKDIADLMKRYDGVEKRVGAANSAMGEGIEAKVVV